MSISEGSVLTASACRPPPWGNVLPPHRTIPRTPTWEGSPPSVRIRHRPEGKETPLRVASCRRRQGRPAPSGKVTGQCNANIINITSIAVMGKNKERLPREDNGLIKHGRAARGAAVPPHHCKHLQKPRSPKNAKHKNQRVNRHLLALR